MYILIFFQQLIASFTHIIAKELTDIIEAPALLFLRVAVSGIMFSIWIFIRRKKLKMIERKDIKTLLILSFLNIPLNQFLFLTSIHLTTAPNVALAYSLSPAFVFVIAILFFKETYYTAKLVGIFIAFTGALFIIFERGVHLDSDYFLGNILIMVASISWSFYTILGRDFSRKYGAVYSIGLTMIVGFFMYLPIFFIINPEMNLGELTVSNWAGVLYIGTITSGVAYAMWYYALKHIEASRVAVFNNLQPVLTTILAVIFLSQDITITFIVGGLMIIAGVYITQRS
jgi:drug/metabolite transporter (DMT)-like permease